MSKMVSEKNLNEIVRNVIQEYARGENLTTPPIQKLEVVDIVKNEGKKVYEKNREGIFTTMESAIESAKLAQQQLRKELIATRVAIIEKIRQVTLNHKEELAKLMVEETGLGNYADKIKKIELVATKTPGVEDLEVQAYSGDDGLTTVEYSPYGVIGAVTPVTNPVETIVANSIGMIASGNSVVFNVHPSSVRSTSLIVRLINKEIEMLNAPANLVTMVSDPTMKTLDTLMKSEDIKLLVGTGGTGLVKKLLQSGKKTIGAGAGNPPVLVDETAEIELAAKEIIKGASFDNNILCLAEKEVFVVDDVADELIYQMLNQGAVSLNEKELQNLMEFALVSDPIKAAKSCSNPNKTEYHINKEWIGKDVQLFLKKLGITGHPDAKIIIFETDFCHPFVQLEQMMPVLPIVRVANITEGIAKAVKAENGNRHTAIIHSQNINNITKFAREIESTIFVKNASSLAGVGFEGEGYTTMSIAGPTGEGLTSAKSFSRKRRCVLGQGGFSI